MLRIVTSPQFQPEKEYAFHVLLREILGVEYVIDFQPVQEHVLRLPNGNSLHYDDNFASCLNDGLFQFPPQDPFSASFFLLTRLEETLPGARDKHLRFPAQNSVAEKHNFLHRPVVNEWAEETWGFLKAMGWPGTRKQRAFRLSVSCDVDHPRLWWSAADRFKSVAGAILKRKSLKEARYWLNYQFSGKKDPYDVFEEWLDLFEQNKIVAQFNFMGERPRNSDCWYPLQDPFVRSTIKKIAERGHRIGFHPGYESFGKPDQFHEELASLRAVSPAEIIGGRQHYLRFSNPETWQIWENEGLLEDSTLGYPEAEGFRCGICHDYPVFDLKQRKMLRLREKPLIAMDVTLALYRGYTPEQAAEKLGLLRKQVEKYGGDFTLLWHNSSWNTPFWEEWKSVFQQFISQ